MELPNLVEGYLAVEECKGDRCRFVDESVTVVGSRRIGDKQVFQLADESGQHLLDRNSRLPERFVLLSPVEKPGDAIEFISYKDDVAAGPMRRRRSAKRGKKHGKKSRVRRKKRATHRGRKRRIAGRRGTRGRARGGRTRRR